MAIEAVKIVNTEFEQEVVSAMVQEAFKLWSGDSTNKEVAEMMKSALNKAYDTGVKIAVNIIQANGSPVDVNQKVVEELIELDPEIQEKIVISSVLDEIAINTQDDPLLFRIRGEIITGMVSGYLSLVAIFKGKKSTITNLRPKEISLFTPIMSSGKSIYTTSG